MLEKQSIPLHRFGLELFADKAPPHITELLGYTGYRRWVAFSWGQDDGFLRFHDGYISGPANQLVWDVFFNHPLVIGLNSSRENGYSEKRFEFGDAFMPPHHWLLSDCQKCQMYAGPSMVVKEFLNAFLDQFPETHKIRSSRRLEDPQQSCSCYPRGGRGHEKINAMLEWLDVRMAQRDSAGHRYSDSRGEAEWSDGELWPAG